MPADLKERLTAEFLKKNMCAPVEKKEGTLLVAVEDPYDLTRLDAIKAMNLAPRHDFVVGAQERHHRLHQRELRRDHAGRPRRRTSAASSWSWASGEEDEVEEEDADAPSPRWTRRTAAS